jgi:hypothetical protein
VMKFLDAFTHLLIAMIITSVQKTIVMIMKDVKMFLRIVITMIPVQSSAVIAP